MPWKDMARKEKYRKRYYEENIERLRTESREYRRARPQYVKKHNRRTQLAKYGLTPEQYDTLLAAHNGVCAICENPEQRVIRGVPASLAVDHDHDTGTIRGLLCNKCNVGIGMFRNHPELLERAISYLKGPRPWV